MPDSAKYLIHAAIAADGVVERSDVVGAVYGQTEGLLGEELDLRRLQESSKLGRIDVEMETSGGQSVGELTVATSLDRVETATLAAALETIDRVGPCRATVEVTELEDVRAAKRRQVIDRAQRLLVDEFEETTSEAIVEAVRRRVATADVTTYEGLPAGPRVPDADALVAVEGRSDVQAVLAAGVKNAVAVEGTDVPEAVAELTADRTTTAFMDGDRGGELILRELRQVGDVDYVAVAPQGRSVEDLTRSQILAALRSKVAVEGVPDATTASDLAEAARARTSGGVVPEQREAADAIAGDAAESATVPDDAAAADAGGDEAVAGAGDDEAARDAGDDQADAVAGDDVASTAADAEPLATGESPTGAVASEQSAAPGERDASAAAETASSTAAETAAPTAAEAAASTAGEDPAPTAAEAAEAAESGADEGSDATAPDEPDASPGDASADEAAGDEPAAEPHTLHGHVEAVLGTGRTRLLGDDAAELATVDADAAFEALDDADPAPEVLVHDDELGQRLLDLAAQRGVREVVAASLGEFTKRPTAVRIRTGEQLLGE